MTLEVDEHLQKITAKKHVKKMRRILSGCVKNKLIPRNPLEGFNCSGGEKDVEPLEMSQVRAIYRKR